VFYLNVTGKIALVSSVAEKLGKLFGKVAFFCDGEQEEAPGKALLSNSAKMAALFGRPAVSLETMIEWQAEWILSGGRSLGKPTHFDEKKGEF
jgi:nucleoside-diphosphate-sugar epimerase